MSSSEFEFRLAWLLNNFGVPGVEGLMKEKGIKVKMVDFWNVSKDNLVKIYGDLEKEKMVDIDGLLFFHKDSFYLH